MKKLTKINFSVYTYTFLSFLSKVDELTKPRPFISLFYYFFPLGSQVLAVLHMGLQLIKEPVLQLITVKFLNFRTLENCAVSFLKVKQRGQTLRVFCQKDANGIANSEDPDQTAV